MRAVVQRVSEAEVLVGGEVVGAIRDGLLVLLGAVTGDGPADRDYIVEKVVNLRVFPDDDGKMNRSVKDIGGGVLLVSQFTLAGDVRKGRRPSFIEAMEPTAAEAIYLEVKDRLIAEGVPNVATGRFRASMDVRLVNRGPVTILLDSRKTF